MPEISLKREDILPVICAVTVIFHLILFVCWFARSQKVFNQEEMKEQIAGLQEKQTKLVSHKHRFFSGEVIYNGKND